MSESGEGRIWRVYHPDLPGEAGASLSLTSDEAHHVTRVLRLAVGARLSVFDGRGAEWTGIIDAASARSVRVRLVAPVHGTIEPGLAVTLYQGLCRYDRMEWVIQKATELGVVAIRPWSTQRSEVRAPTDKRLERWRRIAVESCKQSGRRRVPMIEPCGELPDMSEGILLHPGAERSLGSCLTDVAPGGGSLAVGPEAGLSDEELESCRARGWIAVHLGPRTLRTETAGVVALAILLHRWADLGSDPI